MSIWNSPFEKYEIEKSASKVRGFKVLLSNFRNYQNYHIYEMIFDLKHSQYILDILLKITILQKSQSKKKKKHPISIFGCLSVSHMTHAQKQGLKIGFWSCPSFLK